MEVGASQQRMAAFLRDNHDKVVDGWSELVAAGLRGRTSPQEVRRELEDLYALDRGAPIEPPAWPQALKVVRLDRTDGRRDEAACLDVLDHAGNDP